MTYRTHEPDCQCYDCQVKRLCLQLEELDTLPLTKGNIHKARRLTDQLCHVLACREAENAERR